MFREKRLVFRMVLAPCASEIAEDDLAVIADYNRDLLIHALFTPGDGIEVGDVTPDLFVMRGDVRLLIKKTVEGWSLIEESDYIKLQGFLEAWSALANRFEAFETWFNESLGSLLEVEALNVNRILEVMQRETVTSFMEMADLANGADMQYKDNPVFVMLDHMFGSSLKKIATGVGMLEDIEPDDDLLDCLQFAHRFMTNSVGRLKVVLERYLPSIKQEGLDLKVLDLKALLTETRHSIVGNEERVQIDVPDDLPIIGPKWGMVALFENLINNALKAGAQNITIEASVVEGRVVVKVHDDCPDLMERDLLDNLFVRAIHGSDGNGHGCRVANALLTDLTSILVNNPFEAARLGFSSIEGQHTTSIEMVQNTDESGNITEKYVLLQLPMPSLN